MVNCEFYDFLLHDDCSKNTIFHEIRNHDQSFHKLFLNCAFFESDLKIESFFFSGLYLLDSFIFFLGL